MLSKLVHLGRRKFTQYARSLTTGHTSPNVTFFNTTYNPALCPLANFNPGFKFMELPGARLNIGNLNDNETPEEAE